MTDLKPKAIFFFYIDGTQLVKPLRLMSCHKKVFSPVMLCDSMLLNCHQVSFLNQIPLPGPLLRP